MAKRKRVTEKGFAGNTANLDYARAMAELRRSGAAGKHHDRRTKRNRTRSAQRHRAIRDFS